MKKRIKLLLEQSEKRERVNELLALDELSDELRSELDATTKRLQEIEPELRAAIVAEAGDETRQAPGDDSATAELRALMRRANAGAIFDATINHRATGGVEAELQQHFTLAGNQIPLEMLRSETRDVTPVPADTSQTQAAILHPVFGMSNAAFIGVDMPTVAVGDAVYPVLTTRATVGGPHKGSTEVAETTGAFSAEVLAPGRLQASFFYRRTDAARFAGMDAALRQNLSDALSDAVDQEVVDQIVTDVARTDAAAADSFASYRSRLAYDRLDGRFASTEGDIRLLVGATTLSSMSAKYRGNNADDSAVDSLRRISGGVRVSAHIAAVAANKQDAIVRRGLRRDAVAPMWQGVTIIPDEITKAKTGEIVLTAVMMAAFKVLRTDGFARVQTQHA